MAAILLFSVSISYIFILAFGNYTISSDNIYTKVPYKGLAISIWKKNETFFTFPLGIMEKSSVVLYKSPDQSANKKLSFEITLISEDLRKAAVNHLRTFTGKCIQMENIQMIPTETIHVTLKSRSGNFFNVDKKWNILMVSNPEVLKLEIPCLSNINVNVCQLFKNILEGDPLLELRFNVTGSKFKMEANRFENFVLNQTISDATVKTMVKCKPIELVNMEKVLGYLEQNKRRNSLLFDYMRLRFGKVDFEDSTVVQTIEMKQILQIMLKDVGTGWIRCYRASESGYSSSTFHSNCDNKGPTVTLLRVGKYVSGGYVQKSWNGNAGAINGGKAFLFSLNSNLKFPWKTGYVTRSGTSYGPTFGDGFDLYISNKCNENTASKYAIGTSYQLPDGYTANDARMKLIGQTGRFKCSEYEVYYQIS